MASSKGNQKQEGKTNPKISIIIRPQKAYDYITQIAASTGRRRHLLKKQENMLKFPKLWYNSKKGNAFIKGKTQKRKQQALRHKK